MLLICMQNYSTCQKPFFAGVKKKKKGLYSILYIYLTISVTGFGVVTSATTIS